uniref:Homeobox domain-containing protein n=1 Tax=Arcella intermedia TaxID=1963864 RepID=A0A6B2LXD0_9EUKA
MLDNLEHPYPNHQQKLELAQQTNLTPKQVSDWYVNARRRIVPKLLDATPKQ